MHKIYSPNSIFHQDSYDTVYRDSIENQINNKISHWSEALHQPVSFRKIPDGAWKRIAEGSLPAMSMVAMTLVMDLIIYPIQVLAHMEGLYIYFFISVILGVIALDRSTASSNSDMFRAILGMLAGQFFWHSLLLIQMFANINLGSSAAVMILILVTMLGFTLWRPVLPLGVKFFFLSFLISWFNRILLVQILALVHQAIFTSALYYFIGFLAVAGLFFWISYLIFRASYKIQRFWAALALWQATLIWLSVTFGVLY